MTPTKRCGRCGMDRETASFHRSAMAHDGLQGYCRACRRDYDRTYYQGHERYRRAQMAAWERAHPGEANRRLSKRRDLLKAAPGGLSQAQRDAFVRDTAECMGCGETVGLSFDHIMPVSRGGADTLENAQVCCSRCNRSKRNRSVDFRSRWEAQRTKNAARP